MALYHLYSQATRITNDDAVTTLDEMSLIADLSPEQFEQELLGAWNELQQVPSYVESLLEANRALIESIATDNTSLE